MFRDLSVRQNLEVAATANPRVLTNVAFGFPSATIERMESVLDMIGLRDISREMAANLSHGQTQWLELGMLIMQDPKVLLLDEPTAGMTQAETKKTAEIILGLKGKHTILVVEHDMTFVRAIAEKITVMHLGKFLAEGTVAEIETNEKVRDAYLGSRGLH